MKNLSIKQASADLTEDKHYIVVNEFNLGSSIAFQQKFRTLNSDPKIKIITVVISSFGGQVYSLFSMLDTISTATKPVCTVNMGAAMSCGAILLSAGTKGYRYQGELSESMIHEISTMEAGKVTELESGVKDSKRVNKKLFSILAKNCGKKDPNFFLKEMKKRGNLDWFLSAQEAKAIGLVDHIGTPNFL